MKKGLENIDEIFKQKFEGFEANVDPSVWANVQSSISSGSGVASGASASGSTIGKSLALKLVAGVMAIASVSTATYFYVNEDNGLTAEESIDYSVVQDDFKENAKPLPVEEKETMQDRVEKEVEVKDVIKQEEIERANNVVQPKKNTLSKEESVPVIKEEVPSTEEVSEREPEKEKVSPKTIETESKRDIDRTNSNTELVLDGQIIASVSKGTAPLDIEFDVQGDNIVSYSWDFGDGTENAQEESVFHTFEEPGNYKVELIILDDKANSKTIIKYIEVESDGKPSLGFVPNAFSPNGDGLNDVYEFTTTKNIKSFNARVVNANNGNVVYHWNSVEEGWDGKDSSGNKLEVGPYYLSVEAVGIDGSVIQKILRVTLMDE